MNPRDKFHINYEAPNDGGAAGGDGGGDGGGEGTPAYAGPSQEEFESIRSTVEELKGLGASVQQIQQFIQQQQAPPDDDLDDDDNFDLGRYIQEQIQTSLQPIMPVVTTAAQKAGQERLAGLFKEHESKLGKFDHELAERAAQSYFNETGDPVAAVEQGAKYAAEYEKRVREAAVEEYKKSLKRPGPADIPVEGGGERSPKPAKSYDEVVERWAGQTEV